MLTPPSSALRVKVDDATFHLQTSRPENPSGTSSLWFTSLYIMQLPAYNVCFTTKSTYLSLVDHIVWQMCHDPLVHKHPAKLQFSPTNIMNLISFPFLQNTQKSTGSIYGLGGCRSAARVEIYKRFNKMLLIFVKTCDFGKT